MPDLGNKFECFSCGARFYDLGKSEAVCPKCGANQKDAKPSDGSADAAHPKRRRREETVRPAEEEEAEVVAEAGAEGDEDFAESELPADEEDEPEEEEVLGDAE